MQNNAHVNKGLSMLTKRLGGILLTLGISFVGAGIALWATPSMAESPPTQPEPFTDTACLTCHTDEALLKELAVPAVDTEALSSGPG